MVETMASTTAVSYSDIQVAFDLVLEGIEFEVEAVNQVGAQAFAAGEHDRVAEELNRIERITNFWTRFVAMREEWETIVPALNVSAVEVESPTQSLARQNLGRLEVGIRTPMQAFFGPILLALQEMGGSGTTKAVINRVGELLHGVLNEADHTPVPSNPKLPRWRNTTQWARADMVNKGLLKDDSPNGTWEISANGIAYLAAQPAE